MDRRGSKPMNNESFIELRVAYPSQARVSLVAGLSRSCGLNRVLWIVDEMYHRRDRLADGRQGETFGWRVIGVGVVAQIFNGVGLFFFFLR
jgi:hypothetical protein